MHRQQSDNSLPLPFMPPRRQGSLFGDDTIPESDQERFAEFHRANPEVFVAFKALAHHHRDVKGRTRWAAWHIMQDIRWDVPALNPNRVGGFKISNMMAAYYARLLIVEDPSFAGFFELRPMKREPDWFI